MPCDNADNLDDFLYYLAQVNSVIGYPSSHSCIIGDFNGNLIDGCNSLFGKELTKFCKFIFVYILFESKVFDHLNFWVLSDNRFNRGLPTVISACFSFGIPISNSWCAGGLVSVKPLVHPMVESCPHMSVMPIWMA